MHVVVTPAGVLLVVAQHGIHDHPAGERLHVGEVVLGPVPLVGAGRHKVADDEHELRPEFPGRLDHLQRAGGILAVADNAPAGMRVVLIAVAVAAEPDPKLVGPDDPAGLPSPKSVSISPS